MYRALIIYTIDGNYTLLDTDDEIATLFKSFMLPVPTINKPVLSMEFRDAVSKLGIVHVIQDTNDVGMISYILPHQIAHIDFYIAKIEPKSKIVETWGK